MAIDEAEACVIESELNHGSTFPAVAEYVFHHITLLQFPHEVPIVDLDEHHKKDLSLANAVDSIIVFA